MHLLSLFSFGLDVFTRNVCLELDIHKMEYLYCIRYFLYV